MESREKDPRPVPPDETEKFFLDVVRSARKFLENEDLWCRGVLARNVRGLEVRPNDIQATSWCAIGACHKFIAEHPVYRGKGLPTRADMRERFWRIARLVEELALGGRMLSDINDAEGHAATLDALDAMICEYAEHRRVHRNAEEIYS